MVLAHFLSKVYPTAWQLGLGLLLVVIALFARGGILGIGETLMRGCVPRQARRRHDARCSKPARVSKNFGALARRARRQLQARSGARHALIGPNGAGKTTFINLLTGVLLPIVRHGAAEGRGHHHAWSRPQRVKLGIARTFQINRLFRGLSVLENVYISVAERVGAAPTMFTPAGKRARRDRRGDASARDAQARRRRPSHHRRTALRPPAPGRARDRARPQARGAAARRAGRRRAERGKPHHPRRHRRAAQEHRRADHRPRHGPGVPLRQAHHRAGARRDLRRRHAEGDRRQPRRARGLSRAGRRHG